MGEKPSQRFSPSSNSQYAWLRAHESKSLKDVWVLSLHQGPALLNLTLLEGCTRADQTTSNGPRHRCRRCKGQAIRAAHEMQETFCTHGNPQLQFATLTARPLHNVVEPSMTT